MIIITKVFRKYLSHFPAGILEEIFRLIHKYAAGLTENLFMIEEYDTYIILKGYLDGKRVRILVAKNETTYIPLALYKKESKDGFNIRSNFDVFPLIDKAEICIQNDEFETFPI